MGGEMTHEDVEAIAQVASQMYGQVWAGLPQWSKELWRESVRHADSQEIRSEMERCSYEAKKKWREDQEGQAQEAAPPVEKKSKNKK